MIINRIYETQNLLSLLLVSFLVGLRTYQHPLQEPCKWPLEVVIFLSHLEVQYKAGLANMRPSRKASAALGLLNSFSNAIKHNITGLQNILRILLADIIFFILAQEPPSGPRPPPHYRGFMVTLRHTTLGRTPLNT